MSNYCCCHDDEKKSSSTAKTALGLAIGGLGLAAVNGGVFGGGECGGGGLLGGLFGNRGNCEQLARGRQAQTELAVIHQYLMPTWCELSDLKKQVAVNAAIESKNNEITHLLFKRAEEQSACGFELNKMRTEAAFALAEQKSQCCCDKLDNKIDYVSTLQQQRSDASFALARQEQQCCCDRLNTKIDCVGDRLAADIDCTYNRLDAKTDAAFVVNNLQTDAKICDATKNLVRGEVYLSPASLADPYAAGTNVLMSRHVNRCGGCSGSSWFGGDCGCNGFNW